jgi:beta-N-acetylhexosaminidase
MPAVDPRRELLALLGVLVVLVPACGSDRSGGSASAPSAAGTGTTTSDTAAPPSPARSSDPEAQVDSVLTGMDRRARIGQLLVVGVPLDDLGSGEAIVEQGVGGVFLAGRSTAAASALAERTAGWQELAADPRLWIAADQEGGSVQTLKGPGFDRLPPATAQGDLPADQLTALAHTLGRQLRSAGVNLNLAPVVDIVPAGTESTNGPIGYFDRQYGSTAPEVTAAAGTIVDGLAASQVTATLKHFPGLGRVRDNTDTTADVTDTVTAPDDEQVAAFAALAQSPADPFVMVSSATYERIDPADQAAFSRAVVTDLLRGRLDFDGVVISDDLGHAAAVRDLPAGERAVRFLGAGGTLVLTVDPSSLPEMIDAVVERCDADPAFAEVVDAAVRTALLAKARAGLLG